MYLEMLRKTADDLVRLAGGYNLTTVAAVGFGALVVGFVLGRFFGFFLSILLLALCLLAFAAVAFVKSRRAEESEPADSRQDAPAAQYLDTPSAPRQTAPAFAPAAWTPARAPVELSDIERLIMQRLAQSEGDVSLSALASELDVSGDSVRQTIEELAARGVIALG